MNSLCFHAKVMTGKLKFYGFRAYVVTPFWRIAQFSLWAELGSCGFYFLWLVGEGLCGERRYLSVICSENLLVGKELI